MNCPLCDAIAIYDNLKSPDYIIICPICRRYEITYRAWRFYFQGELLNKAALQILQKYVKNNQNCSLTSKLIAEITGIQSGSTRVR